MCGGSPTAADSLTCAYAESGWPFPGEQAAGGVGELPPKVSGNKSRPRITVSDTSFWEVGGADSCN